MQTRLCLLIAAFVSAVLAAAPGQAEVTGQVEVIDGDSVEMLGQTIEFYGVDALERDQMCLSATDRPWPCGEEAASALRNFIGGAPLRCLPVNNFAGSIVARCTLSGRDVGAWMVANGWAFADRSASLEYVGAEDQAESVRAGAWDSDYVLPWEYRDGKRLELPEFDQSEAVQEPAQSGPEPSNLPAYGPLNFGP